MRGVSGATTGGWTSRSTQLDTFVKACQGYVKGNLPRRNVYLICIKLRLP